MCESRPAALLHSLDASECIAVFVLTRALEYDRSSAYGYVQPDVMTAYDMDNNIRIPLSSPFGTSGAIKKDPMHKTRRLPVDTQ